MGAHVDQNTVLSFDDFLYSTLFKTKWSHVTNVGMFRHIQVASYKFYTIWLWLQEIRDREIWAINCFCQCSQCIFTTSSTWVKRCNWVICTWMCKCRINEYYIAWHWQVEGYTNAIKTPMWLDKVAEKLQNKTYKTVGELVSDIQLIFTNCASFNRVKTL